MDVDLKTIVSDFEKKVNALKKDVDNLEKKKANLQVDVNDLQSEVSDLTNKKKNLDKFLDVSLKKSTELKLKELADLEDNLKSDKEKLSKDKSQIAALEEDLKLRIKLAQKEKENLVRSNQENEGIREELIAARSRLEKAVKLIAETLNG